LEEFDNQPERIHKNANISIFNKSFDI